MRVYLCLFVSVCSQEGLDILTMLDIFAVVGGKICLLLFLSVGHAHAHVLTEHTHRIEFGDSGMLMLKCIACPASKFWEIRQPRILKIFSRVSLSRIGGKLAGQ